MTVASGLANVVETPSASIVAGTPLNVPWPVTDADELLVAYNDDQVAVRGTHYSVTLAPPEYATAQVTPTAALVALVDGTAPVIIRRNMGLSQQYDVSQLFNLPPAGLETALDRTVLYIQQLQDKIAQAVRVSDGEASISRLPALADRKGKVAIFSPTTGALEAAAEGQVNVSTSANIFETRAAVALASIDADVDAIVLAGHTTAGDGGQALYKRVGSEPSHNGKVASGDGAWWEYVPEASGINARVFGFLTSGTAAANTTAWSDFMGYVNQSGARVAKVPMGSYNVNTLTGLNKSNILLDGYGVTLVINAIDDGAGGEIVALDLNTVATADEAGANIRANITVHGFKIQAAADLVATPNKVTGLRMRGLVNARAYGMRFEDLNNGIDFNPRDGCLIDHNQFYQCNRHIRVEDWQTVNANPQNNWITHNNFSNFYVAAIDVLGIANGLIIRDNEFVGAPGVQARNGTDSPSTNGTGLVVVANDFEQGTDRALAGTWTVTSGSNSVTAAADGAATTELAVGDFIRTAAGTVYRITATPNDDTITLAVNASATESGIALTRGMAYIDIRDEAKTLYQAIIRDNRFGTFENIGGGGGSVAPMIMHCRDVNGLTFADNIIPTNAVSGFWLHFDSACKRLHVARPNFLGLAWASWPAIGYDCARSEITFDPDIIHFGNDQGLLTGWNPMQMSTGNDGIIDLDTAMGSNWPGILPPVGVHFTGEMKDSGSATTSCEFSLYPDTTINDNDQWQHLVGRIPAGVPNDEPVNFSGYTAINTSNDTVAYDRTASGANTLDVRLKADWLNMGGGRP